MTLSRVDYDNKILENEVVRREVGNDAELPHPGVEKQHPGHDRPGGKMIPDWISRYFNRPATSKYYNGHFPNGFPLFLLPIKHLKKVGDADETPEDE